MNKYFSLPGFFNFYHYAISFLEYYYNHSAFFYQDRIIDSFYDCDPTLLWRGGRYTNYEAYNIKDILNSFSRYPNIKLRHVFTNCLLNEQLINDYRCNHFVKTFIRPQDEVIINHPLLIQHFKNNYPNINIIYSTTLNIKDIEKINQITKTNIYVMNYNYNNDDNYISQLQFPQNIEIICAEPCVPNCPQRMFHYLNISKNILQLPYEKDTTFCPEPVHKTFSEVMKRPHAITNKRIEELAEKGIKYFKISGRVVPLPQWLETIVYYLALPEYVDYVRQFLLNEWW